MQALEIKLGTDFREIQIFNYNNYRNFWDRFKQNIIVLFFNPPNIFGGLTCSGMMFNVSKRKINK